MVKQLKDNQISNYISPLIIMMLTKCKFVMNNIRNSYYKDSRNELPVLYFPFIGFPKTI